MQKNRVCAHPGKLACRGGGGIFRQWPKIRMIFLGFLCFPEVCPFFGFQFDIATFALFSFAQRSALLCGAVLLLSGVPTSVLSSYRCPLLLTTFFPFISFSFFPSSPKLLVSSHHFPFPLSIYFPTLDLFSALHYSLAFVLF